jgi:catechol 2,3-dioxygenase-like lactoylglutathione lyase family enzyme
MHFRDIMLSNVSILALLVAANAAVGGAVLAADSATAGERAAAPAVSGLNAKVGGFGTSLNDDTAAGIFAALAFPLAPGIGIQIDGAAGGDDGGAFRGVGGHLFWRDPSRGLLGAYASYLSWDTDSRSGTIETRGAEVGKVGLESQLYLGRMTLEGIAAYQYGSESGFAGKATAAYYLHDDFRLHLGASHLQGPGFGAFAGMEWAPPSARGLSWFADVGVNEDRDARVLAGLKLYFSREDKSLIRRHREDDPDIDLPADLFQTTRKLSACPVGQVMINGFCDGNT